MSRPKAKAPTTLIPPPSNNPKRGTHNHMGTKAQLAKAAFAGQLSPMRASGGSNRLSRRIRSTRQVIGGVVTVCPKARAACRHYAQLFPGGGLRVAHQQDFRLVGDICRWPGEHFQEALPGLGLNRGHHGNRESSWKAPAEAAGYE